VFEKMQNGGYMVSLKLKIRCSFYLPAHQFVIFLVSFTPRVAEVWQSVAGRLAVVLLSVYTYPQLIDLEHNS